MKAVDRVIKYMKIAYNHPPFDVEMQDTIQMAAEDVASLRKAVDEAEIAMKSYHRDWMTIETKAWLEQYGKEQK
jgi:hypothetical protein